MIDKVIGDKCLQKNKQRKDEMKLIKWANPKKKEEKEIKERLLY